MWDKTPVLFKISRNVCASRQFVVRICECIIKALFCKRVPWEALDVLNVDIYFTIQYLGKTTLQ